MSELYDTIVVGVDIERLIKQGNLVKDNCYIFKPSGTEQLKLDKEGEYTQESLSKVYGNQDQIKTLYDTYKKLSANKKTMIFCNSIKVSHQVAEYFNSQGTECLTLDSKTKGGRKTIIDTFKSKQDICITNVGVLTTGFDDPNVETIIMYRATKSLSLWLQIIGRGARPTTDIYKPYFTVIDFGMNIETHDKWSAPRNWEHLFYNGLGKKSSKKSDILNFWECKSCGYYNDTGVDPCAGCGEPKRKIQKKINPITGKVIPLEDFPPPTGYKIVEYAKAKNENQTFAFKILEEQILGLFKFYEVSKNDYINRREKFIERVKQITRPAYFAILKSNLPKSKNRTIKNTYKRIETKINKYYGIHEG